MKIISNYTLKLNTTFILISLMSFACGEMELNTDMADSSAVYENEPNNMPVEPEGTENPDFGLDMDLDMDDLVPVDSDQEAPLVCDTVVATYNQAPEEIIACRDSLSEGELGMLSENNQPICGLEDDLTETLKQALIGSQEGSEAPPEVICTDHDQDCYYNCEGWTLSEHLQDRDDRRSSIGNQEEGVERDPSIRFIDNGCITNNEESDVNICVKTLDRQRTFPCHNDGIVFVTPDSNHPERYTVHMQAIDFNQGVDENSAVEAALDISPNELICHYDGVRSTILLNSTDPSAQDQLFSLESSINGSRFSAFSITVDTDPTLVFSRPQNLQLDQSGLAWWEMSMPEDLVSIDDIERTWIGKLKDFNLQTTDLPAGTEYYRFSYEQNNEEASRERGAYLNSEGELRLIDRETEYPLFDTEGPFQKMMSSDLLLGLEPASSDFRPQSPDQLIFSLWTRSIDRSSDELLAIPFVFDAQLFGYQTVKLLAINGMNVLVELTTAAEEKKVWGVYNATTDHLQTFQHVRSPEILERLGIASDAEWAVPSLHENGVSWLVYSQPFRLITISF